jgi:hypothetical protein
MQTRNGLIVKEIRRQERIARHFWLSTNDAIDPAHRKRLTDRSLHHYNRVEKLKQQMTG